MVYKYGTDAQATDADVTAAFNTGMMANTNRGGENVAPGALIGALMGAAVGYSRLPAPLLEGLAPSHKAAIDREITTFVEHSPFVKGTGQ
mmetsp:Transcript_109497/g.189754  ORF Transcript_109497/g.189754 Transcript_109497/m.189754 type:complete len:90 (-) Transcript_109497:461-730(-)